MSKFLKTALASVLILILTASCFAAGSLVSINVDPSINILVNGEIFSPKDTNGNDVMTFTYNGTTYAPLRAMAEAFGLEVGYDADRRMATVSSGSNAGYAEETPVDSYGDAIYSKSGYGDSIVPSISVSEPCRFVFTAHDDGFKSVRAYYGSGEYDYESLLSETEPYTGSTYLSGGSTYDFEIHCDSDWSFEIIPIGTTLSNSFTGSGDCVTDWFQPTSQYYTITYNGDGFFSVKQRYGTGEYDYESLASDTDPYSGTVRLSHTDKTCFFEIIGAEGSWTISPAE